MARASSDETLITAQIDMNEAKKAQERLPYIKCVRQLRCLLSKKLINPLNLTLTPTHIF